MNRKSLILTAAGIAGIAFSILIPTSPLPVVSTTAHAQAETEPEKIPDTVEGKLDYIIKRQKDLGDQIRGVKGTISTLLRRGLMAAPPQHGSRGKARFRMSARRAPSKGPKKADVTVTMFADFRCPYCQKIYDIGDELVERHPGKLRFVFKNYWIDRHELALGAAKAARAALRQGKFWEMYDRFYETSNADPEAINIHAQAIGLDMVRFRKDLSDKKLHAQVYQDRQEGKALGIRGTPGFVINGRLVVGNSKEALFAAVEQELALLERQAS